MQLEIIHVVAFLVLGILLFRVFATLFSTKIDIQKILFFVNIIIIFLIAGFYSAVIIILIAAIFYYLAILIDKNTGNKKVAFSLFSIALCILSFSAYSKDRTIPVINGVEIYIMVIGASYFLFKTISFLAEVMDGKAGTRSFLVFVNYLLFFPTFVNGPMYKYSEFYNQAKIWNKDKVKALSKKSSFKILLGAVKILAISSLIEPYAINYVNITIIDNLALKFFVSLVCYYVYLYSNFSGFCDIAIGAGGYMGFKVPENFKTPYMATNIADFWKRWHITLSRILFEYLYFPSRSLLQNIAIRLKMANIAIYQLLMPILAYMITFVISGYWHGSKANFIIWGLWHGAGVSIRRIYKKRCDLEKYFKGDRANAIYKVASWSLTALFVTLGWMFFRYDIYTIKQVFMGI